MTRRCDCEPVVLIDGSLCHEDDCAVFPWCPHEAGGPYACLMPCRCRCEACRELTEGHAAAQPPDLLAALQASIERIKAQTEKEKP